MKRTLLLSLFALTGIAHANLLINSDFEDPSVAGWVLWWGGNAADYVLDPVEPDHCGRTLSRDDGVFQDLDLAPGIYTLTGSMLHYGLGNGMLGVIRAEVLTEYYYCLWAQEIVITQDAPAGVWLSGSTVVDNTAADAKMLRINMFMQDQTGQGTGTLYFDNISLVPVPEPATLALLGLAAPLLRRRKK